MKNYLLPVFLFLALLLQGAPHWSLVNMATAPSYDNAVVPIATETFGKNSKWSLFRRVHGAHPETKKILSLCKLERSGDVCRISIPLEVRQFKSRTGAPQMVTAGVSRTIALAPDAAGKLFKATFSGVVKGGSEAFLFFFKGNKRLAYRRGLAGVVPAGAEKVTILYRLSGAGEMALNKVVISLEEKSFQEDVIAYAVGYMDQQFHLPEKGFIPLYFMGKRPDKTSQKDVLLKVTLPAGVKAIAAEKTVFKVKEGLFNISGSWNTLFPGGYCCWRPIQIMLSSDRKLNGEEMTYQLIFKGSPRPAKKLKLYTMPVVSAPAPVEFQTGLMMQWGGIMPQEAAQHYKDLYLRAGFNAMRMSRSPELDAAFKGNKMAFASNVWGIRDGYPRADAKFNKQPFLGIDGKVFNSQICPQAVYAKKMPMLLDSFKKVLSTNRFFMNNWEAYSSDYKGCFCNFCKEEFIKHSGLSAAAVNKVWPKEVIARYHDKWVKFRSWQHGEICKTLVKYAAEAGGEFVPMLTVASFNSQGTFCLQYHPDDYLKHLKWINVWGPYLHTTGLNRPYSYQPGQYLKHYYGVKNVVNYIRSHGGKHLNITGLPYGSHGTNLNLPEAVAMETINNFVLGYKGSLVYWFHFDYRYWTLVTRANAKIAACEGMVYKWQKNKDFTVKPVTPYIAPRHWRSRINAYGVFPELEKAKSALITQGWSHQGKTLVAAGNFWERSSVFFKLQVPGKKGTFVVRTPYAPYRYCKVTGKELASGVLLELSPLVWEFFLVEPWQKGKNYGVPFDAERRLASQKKTIAQRFQEEEKILADFEKMFKVADFGFGETPEFTAGGVTLSEKRENGVQNLAIKTPVYQAVLVPSNGANIKSLIVNGKETVLQTNGTFGKVGFWRPKGILIENPLRIDTIKALTDHVEVTLSRPATANYNLKVVWKFYKDRLYESFTVQNAAQHKFFTVTRFHHRPMHLANLSNSFFTIGAEKFPIVMKDRFLVQKAGVLGKTVNIKGGDTVFTAPRMKSTLRHKGLDPIQGYYIWNSPGAATGSFEPIFEGKELAPGESLTIRQEWQIRK